MAIQLKLGTVMEVADSANNGTFYARFDLPFNEPVKYVSPYGNDREAFVAIPPIGSQILVLYQDEVNLQGGTLTGYYYMGSVLGRTSGLNYNLPTADLLDKEVDEAVAYTPSDKLGMNGPNPKDVLSVDGLASSPAKPPELKPETIYQKSVDMWPKVFEDMYIGRGVIPQQKGMSTERGDSLVFSDRSSEDSVFPFQDIKVGLHTAKGKRLELVDSPIVDGLVYANEHTGLDYFIWSSSNNENSPFSEGEVHLRTHGPINFYTLWSRIRLWIEEGFNIDLENLSTGSKAYLIKQYPRKSDGRKDSNGNYITGLGDPGLGPYTTTRKNKFGNQTTGCINLLSHHNSISLKAMAPDSIIYINAPGPHSRIIIESGGSLDIHAEGKLTLQSKTEVEINAPKLELNSGGIVDINAAGKVYIDGAQIRLNDAGTQPPPTY